MLNQFICIGRTESDKPTLTWTLISSRMGTILQSILNINLSFVNLTWASVLSNLSFVSQCMVLGQKIVYITAPSGIRALRETISQFKKTQQKNIELQNYLLLIISKLFNIIKSILQKFEKSFRISALKLPAYENHGEMALVSRIITKQVTCCYGTKSRVVTWSLKRQILCNHFSCGQKLEWKHVTLTLV